VNKIRCGWVAENDPVYINYHDHEWGIPVYDDQKLFEMLILEGAQAGLSWITVLRKRENYRQLFDHFDPEKIILYDEKKIASLLENPGIIRNKLKINSAVTNAKAMIEIQKSGQSFSDYLWQFVDGKPIINQWKTLDQVPVSTPESDAMSKDLKKRGFKFIGTTICYALMQAVGMVNDHTTDCFCYKSQSKR
jgi:DNA-3-methyladenine glycosylase I